MAYSFDAKTFSITDDGSSIFIVNITFDLLDTGVVKASTSVSVNVLRTLTATQAKNQIALACKNTLQLWYNKWKNEQDKMLNWLTSEEVNLENYINTNITF